jgi:ribosome-associated protein
VATLGETQDRGHGQNTLSSLDQARRIAALAQEKLVRDLVVLDLRPASAFTDFFVIATAANPRQAKAIYDAVYAGMKEEGLTPRSSDGLQQSTWVIVDYLDVVLHIFSPEARDFYRLEDLWGDVPQLELEAAAG